jgi:hypothetical protein
VRGGNLIGAKQVLITGPGGVTAELVGGNAKVDESARPLFQNKCMACHEARSPANRTMTQQQWASTVDRMINARGADIAKPDRDRIVEYLSALARAGQITAKVTVAKDAEPGMREVRLLTERGASSAFVFEVGGLPEVNAAEPNSTPEQAQKVMLPVVVNGTLTASGEKDFFTFEAKKGQRVAFNLKGFRLNELSSQFFNPTVYLYNAQGKEIGKSLGKYGLDPVLDWTVPEDGTYTVLVRDLLWKGSPASVYRLAMGPLPADGMLSPAVVRPGASLSARLLATSDGSSSEPFSIRVPENVDGVTMVPTPMGEAPILVRDLPDGGEPLGESGPAVNLPALFRGTLQQPGQTDTFKVQAKIGRSSLEVYAHRLGSPLRAQVTIKNKQGRVINTQAAQGETDLRISNAFPAPGEYTVEVSDADGDGGPLYTYHWEALDGVPDFALTATPDGANLGAGSTLPVLVRATRRENLKGPIEVSLSGLPEGVSATPAVIPPDDDKTVVVLTAGPGVTGISHTISVIGKATGENGQTLVRKARPLEYYRINNQARFLARSSQVVAVSTEPAPFRVEIQGDMDRLVVTQGQETRIPVRIVRSANFNGDVALSFYGLPPGVTSQNIVVVPRNQTEATLILRANGPSLSQRAADLPPLQVVIVGMYNGGDLAPVTCTRPLIVTGKAP